MVDVRPFRALRPPREIAAAVAALPYDVMDTDEARAMAAGNPDDFLHVSRPEIDLPAGTDPHGDEVYRRGRVALDDFRARGTLILDETPTYSVYRQRMGDHEQTGIVATVAITDYLSGDVRTHEHTRPDKELDRVRHIEALDAQDEPVFLVAPRSARIDTVLVEVTTREPVADLIADDGIVHTVWTIDRPHELQAVTEALARMSRLYVADGHHRSAAAARVAASRGSARGPGAHDWFLAVVLPLDESLVLPYHRVVATDLQTEQIIPSLRQVFDLVPSEAAVEPGLPGEFGALVDGQWYRAHPTEPPPPDPVGALDVAVLQDRVLGPIFGIEDPRTDARVSFVGGIRGIAELERRTRDGGVAFSLHATPIDALLRVADAGEVMPPKSTWFEPKLRSGLFVHAFADND